MRSLRAWWIRLAGLLDASRRAREFDAELESHLDMHVADNLRRGMTPDDARRQAILALGGVQAARDTHRDRAGLPAVEAIGQDFRLAFRLLRKAPGFTAGAVLVLALGIGANGAVFSLVNALLLRPWNAAARGGDLVGLYSGDRTQADRFRAFSYPEYVDIRDRNGVFTSLLAESVVQPGVTEDGLTRRVMAGLVSSNYFSTLGVDLAAGRAFTPGEERPGSGAAVAVVGHAYWRRHGFAPDIVGREIVVNGHPLRIVGVAPEGFSGTLPIMAADLWLPFGAASFVADSTAGPVAVADDRSAQALLLAGTLQPGLSAVAADARLATLASALEAAYPQHNQNQRLVVHARSRVSMGPRPRSDAAPAVGALLLLAIAGGVLLVASLNLANLHLARGTARRQEIALRLALGGSRARIVRQLFVEGLLLSAMGGAAAFVLAGWAARWLLGSLVAVFPVPLGLDVSPDARVVVAVAVACVASTLVFAFGPALRLSRQDLTVALKQAAPTGGTRIRRGRLPNLLVASQLAVSAALLVSAGVCLRAGVAAASSDPGFPLEGGLLADLDVRTIGMDAVEGRRTYAAVLDRVRALPGARAVSVGSIVPYGVTRTDGAVEFGNVSAIATSTVIGADYFAALGLPVIAGREFTEAEERDANSEPVAIIDRALSERLFPEQNPIGQSVRLGGGLMRIVGLVAPVRDDVLRAPGAHVYVPSGRHYRGAMTLHVRTAPGFEAAMLEPVREAIHGVDARVPVLTLQTLTAHRDAALSLWTVRFAAQLFVAFGVLALALAAAGVYGLRAYLVTQRTREIGIRVALGATRRHVIGHLLSEGAWIAAAGMAAGLVLAGGLVQILRQSGLLGEIGIVDPLVFTAAPIVLAAVIAAASYLPARKALGIDPATALRPE